MSSTWLTSFSPVTGMLKYQPARDVVEASLVGRPHLKLPTVMALVVVLTVPAINRPFPLIAAAPAGD